MIEELAFLHACTTYFYLRFLSKCNTADICTHEALQTISGVLTFEVDTLFLLQFLLN